MALVGNWKSTVNYALPNVSTAALVNKSIHWGFKALMVGNVNGDNDGHTGPIDAARRWTVEGSSDGVTAAMDGVDRWGPTFDETKLVRSSTGPRSWIVIKSPPLLGPAGNLRSYYILISLSGSSDATAIFGMSSAPFTGSSVSADPTSTKTFGTHANAFFDNTATGHRMHLSLESTGAFWLLLSKNGTGIISAAAYLSSLEETRPGDMHPVAGGFTYASAGVLSLDTTPFVSTSVACTNSRSHADAANITLSAMYLGYDNTTTGSTKNVLTGWAAANQADGLDDLMPCYLHCTTTGHRGMKGRFKDCFLAPKRGHGNMYPGNPVERVLTTHLAVPMLYPPTL